jgi:methylmalonyl-CoA mutase N-terminal domain/subunit
VIDALGGSYFVETLTTELEAQATDYIQRIEALGGVIKCIESGWIQREIQTAAYNFQRAVESKEEIVVGVNDFVQASVGDPEVLRISEQVSREQVTRLKKFKAARDMVAVAASLERIRQAARATDGLMPLFIEAVECGATLGEISDALRGVFGLFKETITV